MKVGDLVVMAKGHKSRWLPDKNPIGIIVAHYPEEGFLEESLSVLWSDEQEPAIAFPDWLEVVGHRPSSKL